MTWSPTPRRLLPNPSTRNQWSSVGCVSAPPTGRVASKSTSASIAEPPATSSRPAPCDQKIGLTRDGGPGESHLFPPHPQDSSHPAPAALAWGKESHSIGAYLDSGADDSFLDLGFARQAGVPLLPVWPPLQAVAIDGRPLAPIAHRTVPLTLTISGNHTETLSPRPRDHPPGAGRTHLPLGRRPSLVGPAQSPHLLEHLRDG